MTQRKSKHRISLIVPFKTSTPGAEATPDRSEVVVVFSQDENEPEGEIVTASQDQPAGMTPEQTGNVLWGASAAAAIAAATAYALAEQRKRKEEEARQRIEAERLNNEARAHEKGYDSYAAMLEAQAQAAFDAQWNAMLASQEAVRQEEEKYNKKADATPTPPPPSHTKKGLAQQFNWKKDWNNPLFSTPTATLTPTLTFTPTASTIEPPLTTEHANFPRTSPYAGVEVKQFCDLLEAEKTGWWYSLGDFTFADCNGLLLTHESAGANVNKNTSDDIYAKLNATVAAQQLYVGGWVPPYCPSGSFCVNGPYNFWAAYSQSARSLVDIYVRGDKHILEYTGYDSTKPPDDPVKYMLSVRTLGNAMLYPESLDPDRWNALSQCGNDSEGNIIRYLLNLPFVNPSYFDLKPDVFYPGGYSNTGLYYFTENGNGIWSSVYFWKYNLTELGYPTPTPNP